MCGEIEVGKCGVCGKDRVQLTRTYFHYDFKCECHSPNHFELVRHCFDCKPKEPEYSKVYVLTSSLPKATDSTESEVGA